MFARTSLPAGFVFVGLLALGCKNQSAPVPPPVQPVPSAATLTPRSPAPPQASFVQPAEPDDASLLARKTSEYANNLSQVLAQPATQPSLVQWAAPPQPPADSGQNSSGSANQSSPSHSGQNQPTANEPATLAAMHLKEDSAVPLILPESADRIPPAAPTAASAPETPRDAAAPVDIPTDDYELKLRKAVQDYPRDLGSQLDYQLLRLVRNEPTPDLSDVSQLSSEDRDLLLALMDGLTNFRAAAHSDGNLMLNRKIQPLVEMADRLRTQGQLAIPTVAFCTRVESFGVYSPMATNRFLSGRENALIVYDEAANFTSVCGSDSIWRTRVRQEMVLYTDTGLAVWPDKPNPITYLDQSRNRRHDFFMTRMIVLPPTLAVGNYVLKLTLTDEESNRVVEASAPLEIISGAQSTDALPAADKSSPPPTGETP